MANAPIVQVPVELVVAPAEFNTRRDLGDLTDLMASIQARGIDNPLLGKDKENGSGEVELFAGFRRLAAATALGLKTVPVRVWTRRGITKPQMLLSNIVENVQRLDLNPIDEALALLRLQEEHKMDINEIAASLGMKKARIVKRLRLLKLEPAVKEAVHNGTISVMSALEIDRLPKDKQEKYLAIAADMQGQRLSEMVDSELEKISGEKKKAKKEAKPKLEGDVSEYHRKIKKDTITITSGLGYSEEEKETVKEIDFKVLDAVDVIPLAKLFDDLSSLVEEPVEMADKAKEAIVQTVEGAAENSDMVLNMEHPEVRAMLIQALQAVAQQKAKENASGKRARVTFIAVQEMIQVFYKKKDE